MATGKLHAGSKTTLTVTGLSTLASATYVASSSYDATANDPIDVVVEVSCATTNTPAGNKQVVVMAQGSYDGGTVWQSGPTSGTTSTDEADLTMLGTVPMGTATTTHTRSFSVASAFGGVVPPMFRLVVKNDLGVALTSGSASTIEYSYSVA